MLQKQARMNFSTAMDAEHRRDSTHVRILRNSYYNYQNTLFQIVSDFMSRRRLGAEGGGHQLSTLVYPTWFREFGFAGWFWVHQTFLFQKITGFVNFVKSTFSSFGQF